MNSIGSKIRELRKKEGATQEDLANLLGVTKSTISKYELGHREISIEQLKKILDFFGIEYGLFLTNFDDPEATEWNDYTMDEFWKALFAKNPSKPSTASKVKLVPLFKNIGGSFESIDTEKIERELGLDTDPIWIAGNQLLEAFDKLNPEGQRKAVERVEELTEIPKYKK